MKRNAQNEAIANVKRAFGVSDNLYVLESFEIEQITPEIVFVDIVRRSIVRPELDEYFVFKIGRNGGTTCFIFPDCCNQFDGKMTAWGIKFQSPKKRRK